MKPEDKKATVKEPQIAVPPKQQSSGDRMFDEAIDKLFPKKIVVAPAK